MSDLSKYLSSYQAKKLQQNGIKSLYELLTHFPFRLETIKPVESLDRLLYGSFYSAKQNSEPAPTYLWQGKLMAVQNNYQKRYRLLEMVDLNPTKPSSYSYQSSSYRLYSFSQVKFLDKLLTPGHNFQILLKLKNDFLSIQKIAKIETDLVDTPFLTLGKSRPKNFTIPVYPKKENLLSGYFLKLHQSLDKNIYNFNLQGLIPPNPIIPQRLDISKIHFPSSTQDFEDNYRLWLAFQVFLKMSLLKFFNLKKTEDLVAKKIVVDQDFLKHLTQKIPFQLSTSQKKAIWSILQEIDQG